MKRHSLAFPLGVLVWFVATAGILVAAPQSPYASLQEREIKALSQDEIAGLLEGRGMGLALAAELNGYPGPKHVLELGDELQLSSDELQSTEEVFAAMKRSAEDLGRRIVEAEGELDRSFANHTLDTEGLERHVARIAELRGQLRTTHLEAHLAMMEILSRDQIAEYIRLRGYHGGDHREHHPGASHKEPD